MYILKNPIVIDISQQGESFWMFFYFSGVLKFCYLFYNLNSIYFNIYRYSAKGEEQRRNTENTDICRLFTPFPLLPEHAPPVHGAGRGDWAHSYCAGGPWTPTVQQNHGSPASSLSKEVIWSSWGSRSPSLPSFCCCFLQSTQQWASRAFWVGLEATVSPAPCMHACMYLYVYLCTSFLSAVPSTLSDSDLWGHAQPSYQGRFVASLRYTLVHKKTSEFDRVHDLTQWLMPRASM